MLHAQSVHVKNRCAFLNHSSNAGEFMQLVEEHPNIALWFSVRVCHLFTLLYTAHHSDIHPFVRKCSKTPEWEGLAA